ncbi:hypothetical protein GCM10017673_57160 [Streptosporangium violaceochromogenes]|nr:hypothetical protein GCM10017673_57160 [Streptosporangium violaceochromogenes]
MNTSAKLGAYALGLAVIFAGAFGVGGVAGSPAAGTDGHGARPAPATTPAPPAPAGVPDPEGLQVSRNGYTLTPQTATTVKPGKEADFRFTVTGPDGRPVTGYRVQHERKLHLIVVPRDLGGFQHLHPEQAADGVWSARLTLPQPGVYRAFADFAPETGQAMTLGTDLHAAGDYAPRTLPGESRTATVDGYAVTLDGDPVAGSAGELAFSVSRDGRPVTDLQPHLGAYGHLVALRAGDLAYLHVHPGGEPGDGRTPAGPRVAFLAEVPSPGVYRLFLDFRHGGGVHTAAFTVQAGSATTPAPSSPVTPAPTASPAASPTGGGHGHAH